jgi:hypothetical protein
VDLDVARVVEALIRSERLSEADALQHQQVEAAIAVVVEDWCECWRDKD